MTVHQRTATTSTVMQTIRHAQRTPIDSINEIIEEKKSGVDTYIIQN